MTKRQVNIIFFIGVVGVLLLYSYQFHLGLSHSQEDWGNFATFLSGVISPILALLNILVFIDLTTTIENNRQKQDDEHLQAQKNLHQEELNFHKNMLIMQQRFEEIKHLSLVLNETLISSTYECSSSGLPATMIRSAIALNSFASSKIKLFEFTSATQLNDLIDYIALGTKGLNIIAEKFVNSNDRFTKEDTGFILDFNNELITNLYLLAYGSEIKWSHKDNLESYIQQNN